MATRPEVTISESLQRKIKYRRKELLARRINRIMPTAIFIVSILLLCYLLSRRF